MYLSHQNFCDGEDLAVGRPASASSVFQAHTPEEAVDGLPNEESCFWSAPGNSHWWSVDLGDDLTVVKIRITNMVSVCEFVEEDMCECVWGKMCECVCVGGWVCGGKICVSVCVCVGRGEVCE